MYSVLFVIKTWALLHHQGSVCFVEFEPFDDLSLNDDIVRFGLTPAMQMAEVYLTLSCCSCLWVAMPKMSNIVYHQS